MVLRYRLDPDDHGAFGETLSDLVGELLEWPPDADGSATVRRRDGEEVSIALSRLVVGKVIPPAPERRVRDGAR